MLDDKNVQQVIARLRKAYISRLSRTSDIPYFIDYLKALISFINPDKNTDELYIYGSVTNNNSNYCACRIDITRNPEIDNISYRNTQYITMNFDELLGTCSTVSFHHFHNVTGGLYPGLFNDIGKTDLFIYGLKYYMKEFLGYSNIFYSISQESDIGLREYCDKNCKKLFEFKNRRTTHDVTYYCENL